jgi:hypothetical protein
MTTLREKLGALVPLAILAYLGFYVYGLVMGAFSPGELIGFTTIAAGSTIGLFFYSSWKARHADERESPTSARSRQRRSLRETRGF